MGHIVRSNPPEHKKYTATLVASAGEEWLDSYRLVDLSVEAKNSAVRQHWQEHNRQLKRFGVSNEWWEGK